MWQIRRHLQDYVRFFVPEDGKNLKQVFPGKKDGRLSERIAWTITEELQSKADFYIDLHAGDTSEEVMPFVYYNVAAGDKIAEILRTWQWQRIWKCVRVRQRRPARTAAPAEEVFLRSSWSAEAAEDLRQQKLQAYKQDVKNIMIRMGLLSGEEVHTVQQKNVTRAEYLEAETDGLWYPIYSAGDTFAGGAASGNGSRYLGKPLLEYRAHYTGSFCTRR